MTDVREKREFVLPDRLSFGDLKRFILWRPTVRILVVADTAVSFTGEFGVGMLIDLIRENVDGYVRFKVDLARLGTRTQSLIVVDSPGPREPKYSNFRFSSEHGDKRVIADYDEIWCFGFAPGNDGSSNDNNIWNSPYASTDQDLAVLTEWMNAGGGMLAMGDHHYLGAAMCAKIPRVRSMRRWTNAQNVPPIAGPDRLDTNQPQNASQNPESTPNPAEIPFDAQEDDVPQPIEWRRYAGWSLVLGERRYRPHPVLCGKNLGVIDVLPDHAHEGWVYEDDEINLSATYDFGVVSGDEYPSVGSLQPRPEVIAWANTLPDPPYNHDKGTVPARRFGLIGAYNGDAADVGRVLVDSTWHHWFDINLVGLEAEENDTEYQKIVRYFRNTAVWLARKSQRRQMLTSTTFLSVIKASYFEDFVLPRTVFDLGTQAIDVLGRETSDCLVRDWVSVFEPPVLTGELEEPHPDSKPPVGPPPDPCWSCPPPELLHRSVLGGIVQEVLPLRDELYRLYADPDAKVELSPERFARSAEKGAQRGVDAFWGSVKDNLENLQGFVKRQRAL